MESTIFLRRFNERFFYYVKKSPSLKGRIQKSDWGGAKPGYLVGQYGCCEGGGGTNNLRVKIINHTARKARRNFLPSPQKKS